MLLRREIVTVLPKQHRPALVLAVFPHFLPRSFPGFTQWQTLAHFWQKRPPRVRPSSKHTKVRFCSENHRDAPDVLTPSRFDGKRRIPFPFAPFSLMNSSLAELFIDSFWQILLPGLTATIPLTAIAFSLALVIAVIVALIQYAKVPVLKDLARFYIWVTRGTPLLVQLFIVFYGLPHAGVLIHPFTAAVIVFSINEGAYCAETMRAALESVPAGQLEAGLTSGMTYLQTIRRIVLPQAFRVAFPTLGNSLIAMVKDTSLAANITVTEMFMTTQRIVARTYEPLLLYVEVGLIYLIFCTVLTRLQSWGEARLRTYVRR